jgi:hypothetical protein
MLPRETDRPQHRISTRNILQKKTPLFMRGFLVGKLLGLDRIIFNRICNLKILRVPDNHNLPRIAQP